MPTDPPKISSHPGADMGSTAPLDVSRPSTSPVVEPKRKVRAAVLLGAVGLALAAVVAFIPRKPSLTPSAASDGPALATAGTAKPNGIRMRVNAVPRDATLTLDGAPLRGNPFDAAQPRDGSVHQLLVSAPGHDRRSLELRFDHDIDVEVRLAEAVGSATAAPAPPKSTPGVNPAGTVARTRAVPAKRSDDLYRDFPDRPRSRPVVPPLDTSESPW